MFDKQINLAGTGKANFIDHYVNGVWQWEKQWYINGEGTSILTDETFTFKELDKTFYSRSLDTYKWTVNTHVKGDKGSFYNMTFVFVLDLNTWTWSMSVQNASCTGNAR